MRRLILQPYLRIPRPFGNNKKHFYLLRGLLVCGVCGRTMVGRSSNGRVTYYCTNQGKERASRRCSAPLHDSRSGH